ncbi:prepilin-type N-terminal cleavage/methylation domain-containing protein [Deinococcus soli (ex Cha et al. 2016)]|uniref:Prepilin-type N-terminal cleavage/methylation domain-containing protein n=2 Tax=Deinococcus soli (ex Cha et al. 2016) TaxID=1309411 RepID=A0ACC6KH29_9DEIO|nr:prepilin-type N-terminal cleavage/methylation domain-containing protein [Deinococcus soli (ex Cha et al. 2016)]MDR6218967.1 prepilin-type N-terminal cleavage/methylation domain-containing protein [Deinococcus soli (ex Cha et al. 2016)]MDR6328764.1 prepilin-type N-terminal cleavage/methylation domain-containing protein [Deinococcus soli (ex Cha et al. 2016)]MDR6751749.1 prepilin-type N-terminal cleavage/methylation domain-containing protein [Deinococcus soli (ex Cha et al. 2016)]
MKAPGFTLIELLVVIAIVGILTMIGIVSFRGTSQKQTFSGYVNEIAMSVQQITSRANSTNRLYVILYDTTGVRWGPAQASLTADACETGSTPTLASVDTTIVKPSDVTQTASGFLCVSAPGLVTRLNTLQSCSYGGATVPCLQASRGGTQRAVLISASGQAIVQ